MKVINAFWEEKNLGVTTAEILIGNDDDAKETVFEINKISKEYVVCKVPSDRSDILYLLQNNGFIYIEDQIEVEHNLHEVTRNRIMQRLYDSLEYREMTETDIDYLFDEISRGMFSSDRISLDPYFDKNLASQRYINWINDLINKAGGLTKDADTSTINLSKKLEDEIINSYINEEDLDIILYKTQPIINKATTIKTIVFLLKKDK